jgi:hypothetical protein
MASWAFRIEKKFSWWTGLEVSPDGKCRTKRCPCAAEMFVASDYVTGKRARVATRFVGYCRACADKLVAKHANDKPPQPRTPAEMLALLHLQPTPPKSDGQNQV